MMKGSTGLLRHVALTLLSAVLFTLSFPPPHLRPLAWIALVPLLIALGDARPLRAAGLGFLWAMAMACGTTDWLPPAIALYYEQPLWLGVAMFLTATATMVAVYHAAFGAAYAVMRRRYAASLPLLGAAAWVAAELARSRMLTGNPWALVGLTQVGLTAADATGYGAIASRLLQVADLGGVYAVSFVVVAGNVAIAELCRRLPRHLPHTRAIAGAGIAIAVVGASLWYGQTRLGTAFTRDDRAFGVAIVQGNLDLGYRWKRSHYGKNLTDYLALTRRALDGTRIDLVFWPENAMTFFVDRKPGYRMTIAEVTGPAGVELVAGGPRYEELDDGETRYFNSAFVLEPAGDVAATYDKEHLLPFAEYFPFGSIELLRRRFGRVQEITPGKQTAPLPTVAGRAAVAICNEIMFPHVVARRASQNASYLLNMAHDGWMNSDEFAEHQLAFAVMRAVEQRKYLVRASTSGPSAIVDAHGHVLARTGVESQETLTGEIRASSGRSLYGRFGDLFGLVCLAATLAAVWRSRRADAR